MKRFGMWLPAAVGTFVVGLLVSFYPFDGVGLFRESGLSNCTFDMPPLSETDETREVYWTILADERYASDVIVVQDATRKSYFIPAAIADSGSGEDAIANFKAKNDQPRSLRNYLSSDKRIVFLDVEKERRQYGNDRNWITFHKTYPGAQGIIAMSPVGFNADRTRALVDVGIACGAKCGEGNFIFLQKVNGRWSIQSKVSTFVS